MELLSFVKLEQNESVLEAEERKRNRERREYFKELQAEGETLWVYPFADSPDSPGTIQKVRVNLKGHLIGTIITEIGKLDIVIERLRVHYFTDGEDYLAESSSEEEEEKRIEPRKAFLKAWESYIQEFN